MDCIFLKNGSHGNNNSNPTLGSICHKGSEMPPFFVMDNAMNWLKMMESDRLLIDETSYPPSVYVPDSSTSTVLITKAETVTIKNRWEEKGKRSTKKG